MPTNATRAEIARLFGRAAFGASAEQLQIWSQRPYADAVYALVDVPPPPRKDDDFFGEVRRESIQILGNGETAPQWWLERMRTTPYPLEERMTLFWHDHFATGPTDKGTTLGALIAQNQLLRKHALGDFRTLCEGSRSTRRCSSGWTARNSSIAPNENYAREFFELFTLGTIPQVYTEKDIRESARVFTGMVARSDEPQLQRGQSRPREQVRPRQHDHAWRADGTTSSTRSPSPNRSRGLHRLQARPEPRLSASAPRPAAARRAP